MQTLYEIGGRRIGVFGVPAIGCVPSQRTMAGGLDRACVESSNEAAMLFNSKLSSQIDALGKKLPDARIVYLDCYNGLLSMIGDPAKYGNHPSITSLFFVRLIICFLYLVVVVVVKVLKRQ